MIESSINSGTKRGNVPIPAARRKSIHRKGTLNNDVLVVGTKTSIHVYDILHNSDLYYKEIADGTNAVTIGQFGNVSEGNLAMIGGNCAIHGFDRDGIDAFWTVTGDNISAIALVDIDSDGQNELVAGSDDNEIQVFKKDAIIFEQTETDKITNLCSLGPQLFAYSLANGTVGVYQANGERLWRIKSKNKPITLMGYDINDDGQIELLTGWSNGKLDIRSPHTGEVLYRENLHTSIAGIMISDYNMDGKKELIVCTVTGEVTGFRLRSHDEHQQTIHSNFEQETIRELMRKKHTLMHELRNYEENYRIQNIADPPVMLNRGKMLNERGELYGAIPANTKIKSSLLLKQMEQKWLGLIELNLETTNDTHIRAAIVFAEGIFKHESMVIYPHTDLVDTQICVELRPPKDIPIDLHVKVLVGYRASTHFHVFELSRHLPRFAMYAFVRMVTKLTDNLPSTNSTIDEGFNEPAMENNNTISNNKMFSTKDYNTYMEPNTPINPNLSIKLQKSRSYVMIRINDALSKVMSLFIELRHGDCMMTNHQLIGENGSIDKENVQSENEIIDSYYFNGPSSSSNMADERAKQHQQQQQTRRRQRGQKYRDNDDYDDESNVNRNSSKLFESNISDTIVIIYCDSINVAGTCIQSLVADHLGIPNQSCQRAYFPDEMTNLKQLIDRVEEIQNVRQHLVAEVADSANLIRSAVVQAEDARLIEEYDRMKQIYNDLSMLNREILREHMIRCQNHQDLVDNLKQMNVIIQRASNLRVGSYKTTLINSCREAIKQKNFPQLFKIISED
ncbi:hypothetical protein RDWZM_004667 [Blomia tropicalis]|uniref:Bardet-Biedl syndrome 2 protein homolog n=1 Tax=Blomia tropicalis TaxID=40697 RepID=A0A9Q0M7M3_BLOTA|nr:hypothetical protein RDWZM_004667 [Blomia tropicalis]